MINQCGHVSEYLEYYRLARSYRPQPIECGAYYGSGGDAETFFHVTDAAHGVYFDCLPLESQAGATIEPVPLKRTELWKRFQNGDIPHHCNQDKRTKANYSSTADHEYQLGACLIGNLQEIGATRMSLEEMTPFRTDVHFQWRHPLADVERPRLLSYLFVPDRFEREYGRRYGDSCTPASTEFNHTGFPRFDFAMTRGFHGARASAGEIDKIPAFRSVIYHVRPGGLVFTDCKQVARMDDLVTHSVLPGLPKWPHTWNNDTETVNVLTKG